MNIALDEVSQKRSRRVVTETRTAQKRVKRVIQPIG